MIHPVLVVLLVVQRLRAANATLQQPLPEPVVGEELCGILTHTQFCACLVEHFNILAVSKKQNQMTLLTTNKRAMVAATTPRIGSNRGRK
jgi:hypothetical protein